MHTLSATTSLIAHSLVWALLYSLWQGLLLFAMLYVLLRAMPQANARVKYYLGIGTLGALFAWFIDTWISQYERLKGTTIYITQSGSDGAPGITYQVREVAGTGLQLSGVGHMLHRLEHYFPLLITVYTAGLVFMLMRFVVNIWHATILRKRGLIAPEQHWSNVVREWQRNFGITRPVQLFLSRSINTPMMLGTLKPVILLPIAAINQLSTEQVEAILLHELVHIKRHDYLVNLLQVVAETILFFNPFVWFISRIVRREREHCCDDMVVAYAHDPLPYASALAMLEEQRISNSGLTLAATGNKHQLFNRIKRIMEMKKSNVNYSKLTIIIVAILAITFTGAMLTSAPSVAQTVKTDTLYAPKKSIVKTKTVIIDDNGNKTVTKQKTTTEPADADKDDDMDDAKNHTSVSKSYSFSTTDGDIQKVMEDVKKIVGDAVASVDFKEIQKEVDEATKEVNSVDWNEISAEINKGLDEVNKELNDPKLRKEINDEVRAALKESKKAMKEAMASIPPPPPVPPVHGAAPVPPAPPMPEIATTGDGQTDWQQMLRKMEKDGLIDRSHDYKVVTDGDELYINGKLQPKETYRRYQQYLENKTVIIRCHDGSLKITANEG